MVLILLSPVKVSSGDLQGAVLGPSLLQIYINNLPECVNHSKIRPFADDCNVLDSIDVHITNRIQNIYKKILIPFKHRHQHSK